MELVVVRHGETLWNKENIFTGWTDIDLSETGKEEARRCAKILVESGYDFDLVYTSVLKRAIHTSNIIMDVMDRSWLPVFKDYRLNERHYGDLQGFSKREAAVLLGKEAVYEWRRTYNGRPPLLDPKDQRAPYKSEMYRNIDPTLLPLGESIEDTQKRVSKVWWEEIEPKLDKGQRILMVMHANSMRAFMKEIYPMSDSSLEDIFIPTGYPLVFRFNQDKKVVSWEILGNQRNVEKRIEMMKLRVIR